MVWGASHQADERGERLEEMDLKTVFLVILRRWYVVVPLSVAAVIFAVNSGGNPTYNVDSSFLLVSPVDVNADEGTNPLIGSRSGLNSVANVAAVVMHSAPRREAVADAGLSDDYLFTVVNLEPFVTFRVVSDNPDIARESATVLAGLYVDELAEQQLRFGASARALVRTELLEISAPEADYSAVRTSQAIYAGAGLLAAFMAAFAIEGYAYFRSPRRAEFLRLLKDESDTIRYSREAEAEAAAAAASAALLARSGTTSEAPLSDSIDDEPDAPAEDRAASRWSRRGEGTAQSSPD